VHAGQREGRSLVDMADQRVRLCAAHEGGLQHAGQVDIVDEPALAAQQGFVFQPGSLDALVAHPVPHRSPRSQGICDRQKAR